MKEGFLVISLLTATSIPIGVVRPQAPASTAPQSVVIGGDKDQGGTLEYPRAIASAAGSIIVLERGAPHLKLFTSTGRLRQQIGPSGAGPSEFREPVALAVDLVALRLAVFDPANGRATIYAIQDTLRYDTSLHVPIYVSAACFMDGRLYALGLHNGRLIHEMVATSSDLTVSRSLGLPRSEHPLATHPLYQNRLAQGVLYCDARSRRIIIGSLSTGIVQLVSLDSQSQETVTLTNFVPLTFEAIPNGLAQSVPPSGEWDEIVGIRPSHDGIRVIIGHADREHHGVGDYAHFREQTISRGGAQTQARTTRWQEVDVTSTRAICYQGSPYPTVTIHSAIRCP